MIDTILNFKSLLFSRTSKNTLILSVGQVVSFIFGSVFVILAAKKSGPEAWGVITAIIAFVTLVSSLGDLGLTSSLFRFVSGKEKTKDNIQGVIFTLRLVSAIFLCLFIYIFLSYFSESLFGRVDLSTIIISCLGVIAVLMFDYQVTLFQAKEKWILASFLIVLPALLRVFGYYLFSGVLDLNLILVLIWGSQIIVFVIAYLLQPQGISFSDGWLVSAKKVMSFSSWMGLNRVAGATASRVDSILTLRLASPFEAGILGVGRQIANAIVIFIASFATVLAPNFSKYQGEHLRAFFKKSLILALIIVLAILLGIGLVNPLVGLFGPRYQSSALVLRGLCFGFIPFALATPFVNVLIYSFKKPQIIAILTTVQMPLVILGNFLLIPKLGAMGPVWVIGLWNISSLLVTAVFTVVYFRKFKQ